MSLCGPPPATDPVYVQIIKALCITQGASTPSQVLAATSVEFAALLITTPEQLEPYLESGANQGLWFIVGPLLYAYNKSPQLLNPRNAAYGVSVWYDNLTSSVQSWSLGRPVQAAKGSPYGVQTFDPPKPPGWMF